MSAPKTFGADCTLATFYVARRVRSPRILPASSFFFN
jgi:hypothetical protein